MDRSKLNRALSPGDDPTPGYLYGEISRMTMVSFDVCNSVLDFILNRLRRGNHNTKFKCLTVIKHLCRSGNRDFKRTLQRNTADVKNALQYRGPPDPLRGDAIYKRVRDAAKEALDAIFNSEQLPQSSIDAGRIRGFGSEPADDGAGAAGRGMPQLAAGVSSALGSMAGGFHGGRGGASGGSHGAAPPSGMQGFGNPNFKDPRLQKSFAERAAEVGKGVATSVASLRGLRLAGGKQSILGDQGPGAGPPAGSYPPPQGAPSGSYYPNQGPSPAYYQSQAPAPASYYQAQAAAPAPSYPAAGGTRLPGAVGGAWGAAPAAAAPAAPAPAPSASAAAAAEAPSGVGRVGGAVRDGSYERQKVEELCCGSGMRSAPGKKELEAFVGECGTLDATLVVPVVLDVLGGREWRAQSKALCVAEALALRHAAYRAAMDSDEAIDAIVPLVTSAVASVRDRSTKLLRLLGVDLEFTDEDGNKLQQTSAPAPPSPPAPAPAPAVGSVDLLGGFAGESAPPEEPQAPAAAPEGEGLFQGLTMEPLKREEPAPPAQQPDLLLDAAAGPAEGHFAAEESGEAAVDLIGGGGDPLGALGWAAGSPPPAVAIEPVPAARAGPAEDPLAFLDPLSAANAPPAAEGGAGKAEEGLQAQMKAQMQALQYQNMVLQQQVMQMSMMARGAAPAAQQPQAEQQNLFGGMVSPTAKRTVIPSAAANGGGKDGGSAFSFMNDAAKGAGKGAGAASFDFITEELAARGARSVRK